ncbi:Pre-mRNA polyadenylation factor Fip1 [Artemisia annua]|uniref:Pre-mRNA polyadenylation factor Fip1 n=1 Tax=Artemisia annua TaxID=35608 RepID=A0A2U1LMG5_ARTAN|nr:Pre-mRNA polyadenylation factor Fip1 [Artemisia annua]
MEQDATAAVEDDDFGDLYADVELEASSAINTTAPQLNSVLDYLRYQSTAYGSDLKGCGSVAPAYMSWEDNGYCQRLGSRLTGPQNGQRFSLPRARNILDVNIDIFEHKPWKHPEVDLTDYFNFGFNEDSWKLYCNQMDEYRHTGHISCGTPASESTVSMEGKGQAIQVANSIFERQSSMDVWYPVDRDSDVIQITILDPVEHLNGSVPEASNHEDFSADDGTDHLSFSRTSEDESVKGNHLEMDIHSSKRSSSRVSSSKPGRKGSENIEAHQSSDGSGGTVEAIRTSNNTKERVVKDMYTTGPSTLVAEASEFEKSSENHIEDTEISVDKREPGKEIYHAKQTHSVHNNRNHGDSRRIRHDENDNSYYSNMLVDKRKPSDLRYHARCNSPVHSSRTHIDFSPEPHHRTDNICISRFDDRGTGEHIYCARDSSPGYNHRTYGLTKIKAYREDDDHGYHARDGSPVYNHRNDGVSKVKAYHEDDYSFPKPDIEGTYDGHTSFGHSRQNERLHAFHPCIDENILYSKSELPSDYYDERFSDYEDWDALAARDLHREEYERYVAKMDRPVFRRSDENKYIDARRRYIEEDRMIAGDLFPSQEFGGQNSKYSPDLTYKRGAWWNREEENLHFSNRGEKDGVFLDQEYFGDIEREKIGSLSWEGRERGDVERGYVKPMAYTRWEFRGPGRTNSRVGSPCSEFNNSLLERDDDRYLRYREDQSFVRRSSEESHINKGGWHGNNMPRNSLYRRHGYSEPFDRDDYTIDIDGHVDIGKTRPHLQSDMSWKDGIVFRHEHKDAEFFAERALFPYEKVSRFQRLVSEHEPDHVKGSIDNPHVVGRKYKPRREGTNSDKVDRTSDVTYDHVEELANDTQSKGYRHKKTKVVFSGNKSSKSYGGIHERLSLSCRNSFNSHLVVGKGKPSLQSPEKPRVAESMGFDSCPSAKADQAVKRKAINEGHTQTKKVKRGPMKVNTRAHVNDVNEFHDQNGKTGLDNTQVLEAMAKMEKRRARFNAPVTATSKDSYGTKKLTVAKMENRGARFIEPVTTTVKDSDSTKKLTVVKMENRKARFNEPATTTIKVSDSTKKLTVVKMENRGASFIEPVTTTVKDSDSTKKLTVAKMENRRARFNEPSTTTIKDSDSTKKLTVVKIENRRACFNDPVTATIKHSDSTKKLTVVDCIQEATSNKQQRPARKRKWGGS